MKRRTILEAVVFLLLVSFGIALRVHLQYLPNFAPVAALALCAGYFFRSYGVAICAPLAIMLVSDFFIGGYNWYVMIVVYAMLALPVALRGLLRRHLKLGSRRTSAALTAVAGLLACSLVSSLLFFAVTNFPAWLLFGMYEPTAAGLANCYLHALPFFRYTLAGDMLFALVLFGGYALATNLGQVKEAGPQLAVQSH